MKGYNFIVWFSVLWVNSGSILWAGEGGTELVLAAISAEFLHTSRISIMTLLGNSVIEYRL